MLEVLHELVPGDNLVLNRFEVTTGHYSVVTLPDGIAKPDEVKQVGRYLNQSPFPPYFVGTGDTQWKLTTDFMPRFHSLGPDAYAWVGCNGRAVGLSMSIGRELARAVAGTSRRDLALPFTAPEPIPFHAIVRRVAPLMLLNYRRRDRREV